MEIELKRALVPYTRLRTTYVVPCMVGRRRIYQHMMFNEYCSYSSNRTVLIELVLSNKQFIYVKLWTESDEWCVIHSQLAQYGLFYLKAFLKQERV